LPREVPEVLFVCTHNAGRSQMAAALLDRAAGGRVAVRSAGTVPSSAVEPAVIEALREIGIDVLEAYPKPLTEESVQAADVVVTMGCGDACPVLPGDRYLDWNLPDSAGADVATVRRIRDDIDTWVHALLTELLPAATVTESR
jgi:arsenate reductase